MIDYKSIACEQFNEERSCFSGLIFESMSTSEDGNQPSFQGTLKALPHLRFNLLGDDTSWDIEIIHSTDKSVKLKSAVSIHDNVITVEKYSSFLLHVVNLLTKWGIHISGNSLQIDVTHQSMEEAANNDFHSAITWEGELDLFVYAPPSQLHLDGLINIIVFFGDSDVFYDASYQNLERILNLPTLECVAELHDWFSTDWSRTEM